MVMQRPSCAHRIGERHWSGEGEAGTVVVRKACKHMALGIDVGDSYEVVGEKVGGVPKRNV